MLRCRKIDHITPFGYMVPVQSAFKKVTVNIPVDTLRHATRITGRGITPTIIEGLHELERRAKRSALRKLRGKIRFELDLEASRR